MADAIEDMEKAEAGNTSWVRTAKDLFAGAAGGVAQVLLGEFYGQGVRGAALWLLGIMSRTCQVTSTCSLVWQKTLTFPFLHRSTIR